jgi:hypothetical protein
MFNRYRPKLAGEGNVLFGAGSRPYPDGGAILESGKGNVPVEFQGMAHA